MNAEHGVSALFHSALSVGVLSPQPRACVCTPAESAGRLAAEPGGGGSPVTSAGHMHSCQMLARSSAAMQGSMPTKQRSCGPLDMHSTCYDQRCMCASFTCAQAAASAAAGRPKPCRWHADGAEDDAG